MRCGLILALLAFVAVGCFGGGSGSPSPSSEATSSSALYPHGGASYAALCQHAPGCPPGGVPAMLRRPLRLPKLRPGAACPVSAPGRRVSTQFAPAIGGGPVYGVGLWAFDRRAVLPFPAHNHNFPPGSWTGQVLKWLISPAYHGPVLIRGRQLDGPHVIGFGAGETPLAEMDLPPGSGDPGGHGWRGFPGYARLRAAGCYGLQVDGATFTERIVFRAATAPHSAGAT